MKIIGIPASNGISISKVYKYVKNELVISDKLIDDVDSELTKLSKAIEKTVMSLREIRDITAKNIDEDHALIFDAHLQIATDPEFKRQCKELIVNQKENAAKAYRDVSLGFISLFEAMENQYMKERAEDIKDVSERVLSYLLGVTLKDLSLINEEVIIVANDLTPSDTIQLNKKYIKGFITNVGGKTSHTAIMARSLEIPAVVGTYDVLDKVKNGELMILDGNEGLAITLPTNDEITRHLLKIEELKIIKDNNSKFKDKKTTTKDKKEVELVANIGSTSDIDSVLSNGAEGIGLYRTEFLYMNVNDYPTEEAQFQAYRKALEMMEEKKVIIRTLDIGGDKQLPYMGMEEELNPFLGHRALRLCLEKKDLFKTQLRALLRASCYGDLHIMFPMVATLNEFREAKDFLLECESELLTEGVKISKNYKVGIMVEIPAVAILADKFAKEVDFFSIGTNDLIQYSLAADRMNQKVAYLYQPYNPAILRMVKMVIDASHKEGKWTGMCGEMAGDLIAAPILLGLGLDEFSMSATSILEVRHLFSKLNFQDMKKMAIKTLDMSTNQEVKSFVLKILHK